MKKISLAILLVILVLNQGCCSKTQELKFGCDDACVADTIIIETIKYKSKKIPPIPEEPYQSEYKTYITEINGKQFYIISREDAAKLSGNWESYKGYTISLRNILYNLKDNNSTQEQKND